MRLDRFAVPILVTVVTALATPAAMAQQKRAPDTIQQDYNTFIAQFREAAKANNSAAVTAMTKFPFYWNDMRDAAYFQRNIYPKIFTPKVRDCIGKAKGTYDRAPDGSDNFTIFCGQQLFVFTRTPAGFRFAETGAND